MYSVIYYTAHKPPDKLANYVRDKIAEAMHADAQLICVGWNPVEWDRADEHIVTGVRPKEQGGLENQFSQMLAGLEKAANDVCFLAEDDVLYPEGAFEWYRGNEDLHPGGIAYNGNLWTMNEVGSWPTFGRWVDSCCAGMTRCLIGACECKLAQISRGERIKWSELAKETPYDEMVSITASEHPAIDLRWGGNLTGYRAAREGCYEAEIPYWGNHAELCDALGIEWRDVV